MIPGPACIVQAAKIHKIADGLEGRHEGVLPTHEYIRKIIKDVRDDDDFTRGTISGTIHHKVITVGGYGNVITVRAVLILEHVHVFSPKQSIHSLNITIRIFFKVFPKDAVPGDGTGIGGGGMLDQHELMKLLKEEERVEQELQFDGILKHLLRLEQEAFIHTLEEESRAEQEWQDMLMKQEELAEEHKKQLFRLYV
ncbi:hypothetical protein Tco_0497682 [Tanacetum coccineum]